MQDKTNRRDEEARRVGLEINKEKTNVMINSRNQDNIPADGQDTEEML